MTPLLLTLLFAAVPPAARLLPLDSELFILDTTAGAVDTVIQALPSVATDQSIATSAAGTSLLLWRPWGVRQVRGIRVDRDGRQLDSAGFVVGQANEAAHITSRRAVAALGTGWLVAWRQYGVQVARVAANGQLIDPNGFLLSSTSSYIAPAVIAANASLYMAAYPIGVNPGCFSDLYARGVRPDAGLLPERRIARKLALADPDIASDGAGFLVVYAVQTYNNDTDVCGTILDSVGVPRDTLPFTIAGEGDGGGSPTVAFDGQNYLVAWRRGSDVDADVVGRRVSPAGVILDPEPFVISASPSLQTTPFACRHRDGVLVTWQDTRHGDAEVYAARVSPAGAVLDPDGIRLTDNICTQRLPCISASDSATIVAWQDNRQTPDSFRIRWRALGPDAVPAGPDTTLPRYVRIAPRYSHHQNPAIAYGDSSYFVAWEDTRYGAGRTAVRGAVVAHGPCYPVSPSFALSSGAGSARKPAVAFCESLFLVTWQDSGSTPKTVIRGVRVRPDGTVVDSIPLLLGLSASNNSTDPRLTATNGRWYLVWNAYNTRVTTIALDGRPANVLGYKANGGSAVAAGATNCALAWTNSSGAFAARTTPDGVLIDSTSIPLSNYFDRFSNPSVAWDGENYAVGWQSSDPYDLRLRLLTAAGQPTESLRITPSRAPLSPSVLSADDGWLVFYATQVPGAKQLYLTKCSPDLHTYATVQFDSIRNPGIPRPALGPGQDGFVVFTCTTAAINGNPVTVERVFGRAFVDTLTPPLPPVPPTHQWPPNGHIYLAGPVHLAVATRYLDADSFSFRVLEDVGRVPVWHEAITTPCCTVPDSVLRYQTRYVWSAQVHRPGHTWSESSNPWLFSVVYEPAAIKQSRLSVPGIMVPTVWPTMCDAITGRLFAHRPDDSWRLDLVNAGGQRVASARPGPDGSFRLGRGDGRRLGAGVYYLRVTGPSWTLTRKLALF